VFVGVVDVLGDLLLLLWMMYLSCFKIDSYLTAIYLSIYLYTHRGTGTNMMEELYFQYNRNDAVAMERLTASRSVIDIYGFCGMAVITEFAGSVLDKRTDIRSSSQTQLAFAIDIAQGLADVHNIDGEEIGPTLVHNDININNVVVTVDDRPLLNDFNIAIPLMKHNETGETCPRNEVYRTEKADLYAVGNIFYFLLVGSSTPYRAKLPPVLPARIAKSKDPRTRILIKAMHMCHETNPKERPSAAELVALLRKESEALSKRA
jgi:serine/threonine protein kinase